jgi:1-acyl-sn-glycerol-3-phosphate acyltransferase
MTLFRSLIFAAAFYSWSFVAAIAMLPLLLARPRDMLAAMVFWNRGVRILLRAICGLKVEFRGLENLPPGQVLVAAKHQCMFDTMGPLAVLPNACFVMKDSLLKIPFYGWYSLKTRMIAIDRDSQARALRAMVAAAKARLAEGRQVVIFPEGHRTAPGDPADYKPGVAALYRALGAPCALMATNSGDHWPAHGFLRRPGTIVYEFLPPIAPGLPRETFMRELQSRLEAGSAALRGV